MNSPTDNGRTAQFCRRGIGYPTQGSLLLVNLGRALLADLICCGVGGREAGAITLRMVHLAVLRDVDHGRLFGVRGRLLGVRSLEGLGMASVSRRGTFSALLGG